MLHILNQAIALFAEHGYDRTSMRDLAERCGLSKSALYHHFRDKDEIYSAIAIGFTQELHDFVARHIPAEGTATDRILAFMTASARFFQIHRLAWLASTDAFWGDPNVRRNEARLRWRVQYEGLLRDLLTEGQESGELAVPDIAMAGRLILSALNWMPRWYRPEGPLDPPQIAAAYHRMIVNGLAK